MQNSKSYIQGSSVSQIGLPVAFAAGVLIFFSPCILPIIPSFIAFITGMSSEELLRRNKNIKNQDKSNASKSENARNTDFAYMTSNNEKTNYMENLSIIKSRTFTRGCLFILGFSIVFVALGASITAAGSVFQIYNRWIEVIGGILIIIFGLNLMGLLKIPSAQRDRGYKFSRRPAGHMGSINKNGFWCRVDSMHWLHLS